MHSRPHQLDFRLRGIRRADVRLRAAGLMALGAFLFAWTLAVSPELHEWLHHEAGHEEHECAATSIHNGTLATISAPLTVPQPLRSLDSQPLELRSAWVASLFSASQLFGRAPPALA